MADETTNNPTPGSETLMNVAESVGTTLGKVVATTKTAVAVAQGEEKVIRRKAKRTAKKVKKAVKKATRSAKRTLAKGKKRAAKLVKKAKRKLRK